MDWISSILKIFSVLAKPFSKRWERWEQEAEHKAKLNILKDRVEWQRKADELLKAWREAKTGRARDEALRKYLDHLDCDPLKS